MTIAGDSTSHSLLADAKLAHAGAWERLVTLYAPLVAFWCRRWGVAQQDIADVLQDVFAAVAGHLDRFRKEQPEDTFRGWLRAIARNKALDYFQKRTREPAAAGGTEAALRLQAIRDPADDDEGDSDTVAVGGVMLSALEAIRGEFHERTWQAFWRVVVDGRTAADVAADLNMQPGAVRVSKSRVLLRLRRELGDTGQ